MCEHSAAGWPDRQGRKISIKSRLKSLYTVCIGYLKLCYEIQSLDEEKLGHN